MPDALLCSECWSLASSPSDRKIKSHQNPAKAGADTCDLCRLLDKSIVAFRDSGYRPELQGADWSLPKQQKLSLYSNRYPKLGVDVFYMRPSTVEETGDGMDEHWAGLRKVRRVEVKTVGTAELEITTPIGQNLPWEGFANAIDIDGYSGSDECFSRIGRWLGECLEEHQICNEAGDDVAGDGDGPKWLVDTGPLDDDKPAPKLVDFPQGDGQSVRYCALSYCWGKGTEENYMTTRETYQARRDGIRFEELPKTFRDAVVIARKIGCRYLWIDAICIIQQDRLDWISEAPRMQLIYGNALLVIAATCSSSPASGIFTTRQPITHFEFDCVGEKYSISVKERVEHDTWLLRDRGGKDHKTMPLHSRAWAYQERLLARRVIHCSPTELVWECKTGCHCECSGIEWPIERSGNYESGTSLKWEVAKALAVGDTAKHGKGAWQSIAWQYTARQLTVPADRLPALSGLARQFAFPQMGKYLAGIWYSQLPDALDWTITNPRQPDGYRAPSWCWASLDGPLRYTSHRGAKRVELIEAECTLASEDPYGEVSDGYIVVNGESGPSDRRLHRKEDYDIPVSEDEELWALKLNMSDWNLWHSLLLKKSRRVEGAWERVGLGIEGDCCFEGRARSTIRIV